MKKGITLGLLGLLFGLLLTALAVPVYAHEAETDEILAPNFSKELSMLHQALDALGIVLNQLATMLADGENLAQAEPVAESVSAALNEISISLIGLHGTLAKIDASSFAPQFADWDATPAVGEDNAPLTASVFRSLTVPAVVVAILAVIVFASAFAFRKSPRAEMPAYAQSYGETTPTEPTQEQIS